MLAGLVSNIQKYSLQDGPGIRTTVFLKGCPLSCAWCHNPENLSRKPELAIYEGRCVRCGECLKVCPQEKGGAVSRRSTGSNSWMHGLRTVRGRVPGLVQERSSARR